MGLDPFLYVALGAGVLLGRIPHRASPWTGRAALGAVVALIFFLGAELGRIPGFDPLVDIAPALGFAGLIVALTLGVAVLLPAGTPPTPGPAAVTARPGPLWAVFGAALVLGFGTGRATGLDATFGLTGALYLLLALVGFDLRFSRDGLRRLWVPLLAAAVGATLGAVLFEVVDPVGWVTVFSTAYGFGWYSLAGPLVTGRLGPPAGLLAFLVNFLREDLTILFAPTLGGRVGTEGLVAMGGATSMDSTLYFAVRFGNPPGAAANGTLALSSGLVLTVAASLLVPLVLTLG